ncbi:EAL domain-containing protein [Methylobacter sp. YRD-M1]|uniref:EAL domain-containing protein n=1 Tax=Methylobacter sp. YRD-M1 TaxID=2911520 RepID=UPI00227B9E64|nr:EAL domain-containing protein [Methylobacter sp. YRD-M1]WAK00899.1 EAL domain-containing protein [Methylobacter sp. YRD-M1]
MLKRVDTTQPLRILIVEDSEDDTLLLVDQLEIEGGRSVDWQRVETEQALTEALQQHWDIVLSDYTMPHFSGMRALEVVRQHDLDLPFIFVSGTIGENTAVLAMKSGAQDYVMKGNLMRLVPAVERELEEAQLRREQRQAEGMLRKLSLVVEQAAESVIITDPNGCIEYVNPAFERLTGYTRAEAVGRKPSILKSSQQNQAFYQHLWQTVLKGDIFTGTLINRKKDGELFYEDKVITPLKDEQGHITHFVSTGRNITERVKAEEARAQLVTILEATTDLVAILDPAGCLRYLNNAGYRLLGLDPKMDISKFCLPELFPERIAHQLKNEALPIAYRVGTWSGETALRRMDGIEIPVSQVLLAHHDASGKVEYLSTIARDISERKRFEAELQHQATHDLLTGLPNRVLLMDRLSAELERARHSNNFVAVLFLDIDNFKRINDSMGHTVGDTLLQQISDRLQAALRPNDTIARQGGDEFAIIVGDLPRTENLLVVLRKIYAAFDRPMSLGIQETYITFCTGIAIYPNDGTGVEELLRNAGTALYRAIMSGHNQHRFYAPDMNARSHELLTLETDLRLALKRNEFIVYYQPQAELNTGRIVAMEALIRWRHPQRGLVSPAGFVSMLEESGLIMQAGEWILNQACTEYREMGLHDVRISVNVSASQFNDPDLLHKVCGVMKRDGIPPNALELEMTENTIMQDPAAAAEILKKLRALGVRIAIDDFGTGYSSLSYLKRFPLDALKIDQGFVRDLTRDPNDAAIVEASITLGKKLGLEVVAEGVEDKEQFDFLRAHDCDLAQGYYVSRPLRKNELIDLLREGRRW